MFKWGVPSRPFNTSNFNRFVGPWHVIIYCMFTNHIFIDYIVRSQTFYLLLLSANTKTLNNFLFRWLLRPTIWYKNTQPFFFNGVSLVKILTYWALLRFTDKVTSYNNVQLGNRRTAHFPSSLSPPQKPQLMWLIIFVDLMVKPRDVCHFNFPKKAWLYIYVHPLPPLHPLYKLCFT